MVAAALMDLALFGLAPLIFLNTTVPILQSSISYGTIKQTVPVLSVFAHDVLRRACSALKHSNKLGVSLRYCKSSSASRRISSTWLWEWFLVSTGGSSVYGHSLTLREAEAARFQHAINHARVDRLPRCEHTVS